MAAPSTPGVGAPAPTARAGGAARDIGERRVRERAPGEPRRVAYLYLAPAFAFYLLFAFGPLVYTTWLSFFDWDGLTVGTWAGLDNYREVLEDPGIRASFVHSLVLIVFYALLPCALGLFLAALIAHGRVRGVTFFRAVLFLPQTIAIVVVALAWVWIYAPDGPLNAALDAVGLDSVSRGWLGDFTFALPALGSSAPGSCSGSASCCSSPASRRSRPRSTRRRASTAPGACASSSR